MHKALPQVIEGLACVAAATAQPERALRLAEASAALRETLGVARQPEDAELLVRHIGPLEARLEADAVEQAKTEGRAMSVNDAIGYALASEIEEVAAPASHFPSLT